VQANVNGPSRTTDAAPTQFTTFNAIKLTT